MFTAVKPNLEKSFLGLKVFPEGRTAHQLICPYVYPNSPTRKKIIFLGPCQKGNIVVKNFQDIFWQSGHIRVSYYLDIGNFFYQKNIKGIETKFREIDGKLKTPESQTGTVHCSCQC